MDREEAERTLLALSDEDVASMATPTWSENAEALRELARRHPSPLTRRSGRCFWSCRNGRERARASSLETDERVPVVKELFELCASRPDGKTEPWVRASFAISRLFAWHCAGEVHVFLGSDKGAEPTGFHAGNNFWEAELPVLQCLRRVGVVTSVAYHVYAPGADEWSLCERPEGLPLLRRYWHPLDDPEHRPRFVHSGMTQEDYDRWRTTPPRPFLALGRLRLLLRRWARRARSARDARSSAGVAIRATESDFSLD